MKIHIPLDKEMFEKFKYCPLCGGQLDQIKEKEHKVCLECSIQFEKVEIVKVW